MKKLFLTTGLLLSCGLFTTFARVEGYDFSTEDNMKIYGSGEDERKAKAEIDKAEAEARRAKADADKAEAEARIKEQEARERGV